MESPVIDLASSPATSVQAVPHVGPGFPPAQFQFSKANAREKQAKSRETLRKRLANERAASNNQPLPAVKDAKQIELPARANGKSYVRIRLIRVRKQLDRLDALIASETDPAKLDKLASAQLKSAQQERELSGRPAPGTLKPSSPATVQPGRALNYLQGSIKPQSNRHVEQE